MRCQLAMRAAGVVCLWARHQLKAPLVLACRVSKEDHMAAHELFLNTLKVGPMGLWTAHMSPPCEAHH